MSSGLAERMSPAKGTNRNYGDIDFVESDGEYDGYHIPAYATNDAIQFLDAAQDNDAN